MASTDQRGVRSIAAPYPVPGPTGVAVRTRLKHLTVQDEKVLRLVGAHLGSLAAADLKARCADGLDHDSASWAERKRDLTPESSSRWAGSITKATHDQWALARRGQVAHLRSVEAGVATMGKRFGNETIRVGPEGEVSIKLPAPLKEWANAPHGRYVLSGKIAFAHRGQE